MTSPSEVWAKLESGEFEALVGLAESSWMDAKAAPYEVSTPKGKNELAKDVSAFANSEGGIIVIGFHTARDATKSVEHISKVNPFPQAELDIDQYRKILRSSVAPPLDNVEIRKFDGQANDGSGVAAIFVNTSFRSEKPYLVGNTIDENGRQSGIVFSYFERKHDHSVPMSLGELQKKLSMGFQSSAIHDRLNAIEARISTWGAAPQLAVATGLSPAEVDERLIAARVASGRDDSPLLYLMAVPEGNCDFPNLFQSRAERVVRLFEKPHQLRRAGFEVWGSDASEIVEGKLRRSVINGYRLLELWKDGLFIHIAPGDEDFLGWSVTHSEQERKIRINNFVLAEVTLHFCWLVGLIFAEAKPEPTVIRLVLGIDNMSRNAGPAYLRDAPDRVQFSFGEQRDAPGSAHRISQVAELSDYDPERLAYQLLEKVYNWCGFPSQAVPYVRPDSQPPRLSAEEIIGSPLPVTVETPGFY